MKDGFRRRGQTVQHVVADDDPRLIGYETGFLALLCSVTNTSIIDLEKRGVITPRLTNTGRRIWSPADAFKARRYFEQERK
jgi:hypothetical protein